jgi:hypothetical protein
MERESIFAEAEMAYELFDAGIQEGHTAASKEHINYSNKKMTNPSWKDSLH